MHDPNGSQEALAARALYLVDGYRFLDSSHVCFPSPTFHSSLTQFQGTDRISDAMYASTILRAAISHVYQSKQWRSAMAVTFERVEDYLDYPDVQKTVEDDWMSCPPPSVVAFIGTLVSKHLLCELRLTLSNS